MRQPKRVNQRGHETIRCSRLDTIKELFFPRVFPHLLYYVMGCHGIFANQRIFDIAFAPRQCRADECPVGQTFGGGNRYFGRPFFHADQVLARSSSRFNRLFMGLLKNALFVIPAKAGIQSFQALLDSRLRGNDIFQQTHFIKN